MSRYTSLLLAAFSLLGNLAASSNDLVGTDKPASGAGSDAARRIRGQRQPGGTAQQPGETAVTAMQQELVVSSESEPEPRSVDNAADIIAEAEELLDPHDAADQASEQTTHTATTMQSNLPTSNPTKVSRVQAPQGANQNPVHTGAGSSDDTVGSGPGRCIRSLCRKCSASGSTVAPPPGAPNWRDSASADLERQLAQNAQLSQRVMDLENQAYPFPLISEFADFTNNVRKY